MAVSRRTASDAKPSGSAGPVRGRASLGFDALVIEGGLLSAGWLARVAQLRAGSQAEADYRVPKGLNLRDEIGRYWRIAQAHWADFDAGRASGADPQALSTRFVEALLRDSFAFASLAEFEARPISGRLYPITRAAVAGRVPVVIAPAGSDWMRRRRRSATAAVVAARSASCRSI